MRRREFITLLGGAAASWPVVARAQQTAKLPTIGFLGTTTAATWKLPVAAFEQRLRELGWIAGRTVAIDYRWSEGSSARAAAIASEFVRLKVNIIVTGGNAVAAAKQATPLIPIVFAVAVDPVGSGFVASLSRPGGNVTGLSLQAPEAAGKRLELLREVVPTLRQLAIIANVGYPAAVKERDEVEDAVRVLGLESIPLNIGRTEDIGPAFESLNGRAQALYVVGEALINTNRIRISTLALGARLPAMYGEREYVVAGGLMSYGPNLPGLFTRAADLTDKILHGAKPADIPVEQPTKFDLVINLTTAKALSLTVPPTLLARADEVIE
jgi:ABC-type uncharacterized transport system substrate-binding protein